MAQLKEKTDYDEIFMPVTFNIEIRCNHCGSMDCFIGININEGLSFDVVCHSCGHIEGIY